VKSPAPANDPPVIELRRADIGPDPATGLPFLGGVDWRVAAGDWWVVGGGHRSGKSALLATAAGVQRPMSGGHSLFGEETEHLSESRQAEHRRRVGLVFENGGRLFAHLTVAGNVALPLQYHRDCDLHEASGRVAELLDWLGLSRHTRAQPDRLGRDLRQRAALARALALAPDVLLLDNPLAGLTARERESWLGRLTALHNGHALCAGRPLTLAVTADDVEPWAACGKQFAVIHDGQCRALGGRESLPECFELLACDPMAPAAAED
jgi:putative ABC transport system ATP-binding protein